MTCLALLLKDRRDVFGESDRAVRRLGVDELWTGNHHDKPQNAQKFRICHCRLL
jgi:hypothetical protein